MKNTTHHVITRRFLASFSATRNSEWAEKKIKTVHTTCVSKNYTKTFMRVPPCTIDMVETRTIYEQLRLKLCKNVRTMRLGQNLLVPINKACSFQNIWKNYVWSTVFYLCWNDPVFEPYILQQWLYSLQWIIGSSIWTKY